MLHFFFFFLHSDRFFLKRKKEAVLFIGEQKGFPITVCFLNGP